MVNAPFLKKNLEFVRAKHPHLLAYIELENNNDTVEVNCFRSASGDMTAKAFDRSTGREVLLHCHADPVKEAQDITDSIGLQGGELRCLIGMGLGYMAIEIVRRKLPLHKLLIIEGSPNVFKAAMAWVDLELLLNSESVTIFIGIESNIERILEANRVAIHMHGLPITTFEPCRQLLPDFYTRAAKQLREAGLSVLEYLVTARNIGKLTLRNIMENCTEVIKSANLGVLKNAMIDRPAVVIGAGPSLNYGMTDLKRFGKKAFIVCVDSALPVLVREGIKPDIVVTVDYSYLCVEKFREVLNHISDVPMCYILNVNPLSVKLYPAAIKFFTTAYSSFIDSMRKYWGKEWASMPPMQGVAHLAYVVAVLSGASPIILLGFDMAYTGLKSHAEGMSIPLTISIEDSPWVEGIDGEMLPTLPQMAVMRSGMEFLINYYKVPCFNANKMGARIAYAEQCDLGSFLAEAKDHDISASALIKELFQNAPKPSADDMMKILDTKLKAIDVTISKCRDTICQADRTIEEINKDPIAEGEALISTQNEIQQTLEMYENTMLLISNARVEEIGYVLSSVDLELQSDEARLETEKKDLGKKDKVCLEIQMLKKAMNIRIEVLSDVEQIFKKLHSRFYDEKKLLNSLKSAHGNKKKGKILQKIGATYLEYGDLLPAEEKLLSSLSFVPYNAETYFLLGKALSLQNRHKEAIESFKQGDKLSSKKNSQNAYEEESKWLGSNLQTAKKHMFSDGYGFSRLPWAIKMIKEILQYYPDNQEAQELLLKGESKIEQYQKDMKQIVKLLDGEEGVVVNRLDDLLIKGETNLAKKLATILLKKYPKSASARERLAILVLDEGDKKQAKDLLIQAISLDPEHSSAMVHMGMILAEEGNFREAQSYLMKALNMDQRLTILHESLGDLSFMQNDYNKAIDHYEKFFISYPNRKDILKKTGDCYYKLGKIAAAEAAWGFCR